LSVYVGRPDPTPNLLKRQREVFRIAKNEVDGAPRLLVQDTPEEAKRDVENDMEEEMNSNEDVHKEEEKEMDDDVGRKDSFYGTEEDDVKVTHFLLSPASVGILLFIAVIVGLVVTWYTRKVQRNRSGLRKKLDV
jgi:hypothetical protein